MGLYENIDRMWFGTEQKMGWIETPQTGADVSSFGQSANAILENGGGTVRNSWDSHKVFQFSWGVGASQSLVSLLQAYRNGSYGRGFLYFHDPMYYATNLLPKRWADPSMAVNFEAEPLIPDVWPTAIPVTSTANNYPVNSASYAVPANYSSQANSSEHFIPIPDGMVLVLGAVYSGSASVYVRTPAGVTDLVPMAPEATTVVNTVVRNQPWARLGIRKVGSAGVIAITGMSARLANSVPANDGQTMTYANIATAPSFEIGGASVEIRRNRVPNPSFEVNTTGWIAARASVTRDTSRSRYGTASARVTATDAAAAQYIISDPALAYRIAVSGGESIPLLGSVYPEATNSFAFQVYEYDAAGALISPVITTPYRTAPAGQWTDLSMTVTVKASAATIRLVVIPGTSMSLAQSYWVDALAVGTTVYFDGSASPDPDMTASWDGPTHLSASILSATSSPTPIAGFSWSSDNTDFCIQSSQWSRSGTRSARMISRTSTATSYRYLAISALPNGTYTVVLPIRLQAAQSNPSIISRTLDYRVNSVVQASTEQAPNEAGESELRLTFTKTESTGTHLLFVNQRVPVGDADLWMDDFTLVEGAYAGPAFTGYTPGAVWNGAPNASTSTLTVNNPISGEIGLGPWYSGEGHSGCRFQGNPTVINYNGVSGGQIGLSAILQEVGAWE